MVKPEHVELLRAFLETMIDEDNGHMEKAIGITDEDGMYYRDHVYRIDGTIDLYKLVDFIAGYRWK